MQFEGFADFLGAVELHHENWDGTGYPHGQKEYETPIDARIIHVGYTELRQVLSPRWFVAGRYSITSNSADGIINVFETAAGFRPDRFQLLKIAYREEHYSSGSEQDDRAVAIQFITTLHKSAGR